MKHSEVTLSCGYWDALAPHHSSIENNYLDLPSLRRIVHDIHQPVLVVGAGQGPIVAELCKNGFRSDGVDLSSEMIRYAKTRRGLKFVQADANMQRIFRKMDQANLLINAAPERQPYRNEPEIRNLFKRLAIPIKKLEASGSCYMVQI
jgi:SAM-dependent methyltransferase